LTVLGSFVTFQTDGKCNCKANKLKFFVFCPEIMTNYNPYLLMDFDIPLDNPICCQGQTEQEPEASPTTLDNLTTTLKAFTIYGDASLSRHLGVQFQKPITLW
jgi:hypothetical protein